MTKIELMAAMAAAADDAKIYISLPHGEYVGIDNVTIDPPEDDEPEWIVLEPHTRLSTISGDDE